MQTQIYEITGFHANTGEGNDTKRGGSVSDQAPGEVWPDGRVYEIDGYAREMDAADAGHHGAGHDAAGAPRRLQNHVSFHRAGADPDPAAEQADAVCTKDG